MTTFLRWSKVYTVSGELNWHGSTTTGYVYVVRTGTGRYNMVKKKIVYLNKPTSSWPEICKNIRHAKEYADELARLAGFEPWQKK